MLPRGTGTPLETLGPVTKDMQKVLGSPGSLTPLGRGSVGTHPACALLSHRLPNNLWLSPGAPQNYRDRRDTVGTRGGCLPCPQVAPRRLHPTRSRQAQLGRIPGGKSLPVPPGSLSGLSCSAGGRNEPLRGFPPASAAGRARSCVGGTPDTLSTVAVTSPRPAPPG